MDLRQLRYFLEVADQGGFNRAASHLHVAQSALSRQVRELEAELNTALFVRTATGVQLTAAGKLTRARAEALLSNVRSLREEVMAEANVIRGEVRLGMPPSLERPVTIPLIERLRRSYPGVFVKSWVATSVTLRDMVLSGEMDMAVIGILEAEPILSSQSLFADDMYLIGPRGSLDGEAASVGWERVGLRPLMLTSRPNSFRLLVDRAAARANCRLNVVMEVNYVPVLMELVRDGIGFTLLPGSALKGYEPRDFATRKVTDLAYEWVLVAPKQTELSAASRATRELLLKTVAELEGPED